MFVLLAAVCLFKTGPANAFRAEPSGRAANALAQPPIIPTKAPAPSQTLLAEQAQASGVKIKWNERLGTPQSVRGRNLGQPNPLFKAQRAVQAGANPELKAIAILDNLSELYALQNSAAEFTLKTTQNDALGFQHIKLTQIHSGLRVVGGELIVHFNSQGEAYEVNGQYVAGIDVDVYPALDMEQAALTAQQDQGALGNPPGSSILDPELVVFAFDSQPRLAYELTIYYSVPGQAPGRWRYWIDAQNGEIIRRFNDIQYIEPPSTGSHTNIAGSVLAGEGGKSTNVAAWFNTPNSYYYLYNTNSQWIISNACPSSSYLDAASYAYRANTNWGVSDRPEISAANNFHYIQQYYATIQARLSFDNLNSLALVNIHIPDPQTGTYNYNNAYWDGKSMNIGDGDGRIFNPLGVLDVCGHEFTHAVTEHSANLYYDYVESGALNESFSDIFGTCIEYHAQPDGSDKYPSSTPGHFDWLMGEDCCVAPYRTLRDLRNPSSEGLFEGKHPSRYKGAYWDQRGEMHYNSTVQSFMFYLLCEGGSGNNDGIAYTVTGIALTNAEQIAYRTLTVYLTQYACYADSQEAWISAAADLNTNWVASVRQAWSAVGFTDTASSALGAAVNAPDSTWYTGGNANWFAESSITHDGSLAAQSAPMTNDQMSKIYSTITGPGTVTFWWKVSSEANYDFLSFSIDGANQAKISGETDWQYKSFPLGDGAHVLKWIYKKDMYVSQGADAGWLDEVTLHLPLMITVSKGAYEDQIALSWNPKNDATAYEIWRAKNVNDPGRATHLIDTTATTYNDKSAIAGVVYYYWIKAKTPSGTTDFKYYEFGWRSWNYTPTGIAATDGTYTDKIQIAWTPSANAASYTVYRNTTSDDSGAVPIVSTTGTVVNDTSATAKVIYYYWVKGMDAHGVASGFSLPDAGWRSPPPPKPDSTNIPALRATDFQMAPSAMQLGSSPDQAVIRIVNTSVAATNARVTLTIYFSNDGIFGSLNNISLGSVQRYVTLAGGQSVDINLNSAERANFRVPSAVALGYYRVFLKATTTQPAATNNVLALGSSVQVVASRLASRNDFDNDGKTDLAIYNPGIGIWKIRGSATGSESAFACGGPGCVPVAGDFDGDGKADLAVYQESGSAWLFLLSGSLYNSTILNDFGGPGYAPVSGDFDGDRKADPALYNASTGVWMVQLSGSSYTTASTVLGAGGCKAVAGDFDGDGKADPAVFHPSSGLWQVMLSGNNYTLATAVFGDADCVPITGDFDGDLKSDPAIYREIDGLWAVMLSADNYTIATAHFGGPGFVQVSGDFDGDGKTDLMLYQSNGTWSFRGSKTGYPLSYLHFGGVGFIPTDMGN